MYRFFKNGLARSICSATSYPLPAWPVPEPRGSWWRYVIDNATDNLSLQVGDHEVSREVLAKVAGQGLRYRASRLSRAQARAGACARSGESLCRP